MEKICNKCVDHQHNSNPIIVRKILCRACNSALGMMNENSNKILKLSEYAKYCERIKGCNNGL